MTDQMVVNKSGDQSEFTSIDIYNGTQQPQLSYSILYATHNLHSNENDGIGLAEDDTRTIEWFETLDEYGASVLCSVSDCYSRRSQWMLTHSVQTTPITSLHFIL